MGILISENGHWVFMLSSQYLSMFLIQAAVTIVTSPIAIHFFALQVPAEYIPHLPAIMVILALAIILYIGKYNLLDKVMKAVIIILTLTTITALATVLLMAPGGICPEATLFKKLTGPMP